MTLKATIFTFEYPPNYYGGVGIHVQYLTQKLSEKINVEIRCPYNNVKDKTEKIGNITLRWLATSSKKFENPVEKVYDVMNTDRKMAELPVDGNIIHTHTWYAAHAGVLAKTFWNKPLIVTTHSLEPRRPWKEEQLQLGYRLSSYLERTALIEADHIIAVSAFMKDDIQKIFDIRSNKITAIPNGIDIQKYRRKTDSTFLRQNNIRKPYVLFVGRLSRQKGVFDLVDASRYFNDNIQTVIVTGKEDTPGLTTELKNKIDSAPNKNNILWLNKMFTEEQLIYLYSSAETLVCPSIYEPFGIVNLEAMACETPVVATSVGGIPEIVVHNNTGYLVKKNEIKKLADRINIIVEDEQLREKFGTNSRRRVEKYFTWQKVADRTLRVYEKIKS